MTLKTEFNGVINTQPPKRVYISGKITGLPLEDATHLFQEAEDYLLSLGHEVCNPMKVLEYHPDLTWRCYMKADIKELVECDAIYMLTNWDTSKGAKLELEIAKGLDLTVYYQL